MANGIGTHQWQIKQKYYRSKKEEYISNGYILTPRSSTFNLKNGCHKRVWIFLSRKKILRTSTISKKYKSLTVFSQ